MEFNKDINRFLEMSFESRRTGISTEDEFASARGWLTQEQEADNHSRHEKEFPEHMKRMKSLWKYIRMTYTEDVRDMG